MINLIKDIFTNYGYINTELDEPGLTLYSNSDGCEEYWLVANVAFKTNILNEQPEFFKKCAAHIDSPALEKNLSLLVVWETTGHFPLEQLKKKIMQVEEDAYFFKKYVLHYSPDQEKLLKEASKESTNFKEFLTGQIINQKTFQRYKNEKIETSDRMTWESLLYRIAIKIPFINVNIKSIENLESLNTNNQQAIIKSQDVNIITLNEALLSLENKSYLFDADTKPEELLNAIEGKTNENTD